MNASARARQLSPYLLAGLLAAAGVTHFVHPDPYARIVPHVLPARRALVALSGVAELGLAAALVVPRTRRLAGWATAGLFVAVFPANVQMALDAGSPGSSGLLGNATLAWLRLPVQVPLVLWAVFVARTARRRAELSGHD
ncbi:MAG: DoxX family protein [Mycobacteriales bacterium]